MAGLTPAHTVTNPICPWKQFQPVVGAGYNVPIPLSIYVTIATNPKGGEFLVLARCNAPIPLSIYVTIITNPEGVEYILLL
jgi:hypothetical protein